MHPTLLARNMRWLASAVFLAVLGTSLAAQTGDFGTLVLDLTDLPTREEQGVSGSVGPGIAGSSVGVTEGGGQVSPPYALPLSVQVQSLSPQVVRMGEKFKVEILLTNNADSAFLLPASQRHATILKQGNKGRRTFLFSLTIEDPTEAGRQTSAVMASSDGASTIPSSFLRIKPGQSVHVLFTGELYPVSRWFPVTGWLKPGLNKILVRAQVSEWRYEDNRYFIENRSEPVVSGNFIVLDLARPD